MTEKMDGETRFRAVVQYQDGTESGEFCDWFKTIEEAEQFYRDIMAEEGRAVEYVRFYGTRVVVKVA